MTRDDVSDIKSLHERVVQCTVEFERAELVLKDAKRRLDHYLSTLVKQDPKPPTPTAS